MCLSNTLNSCSSHLIKKAYNWFSIGRLNVPWWMCVNACLGRKPFMAHPLQRNKRPFRGEGQRSEKTIDWAGRCVKALTDEQHNNIKCIRKYRLCGLPAVMLWQAKRQISIQTKINKEKNHRGKLILKPFNKTTTAIRKYYYEVAYVWICVSVTILLTFQSSSVVSFVPLE